MISLPRLAALTLMSVAVVGSSIDLLTASTVISTLPPPESVAIAGFCRTEFDADADLLKRQLLAQRSRLARLTNELRDNQQSLQGMKQTIEDYLMDCRRTPATEATQAAFAMLGDIDRLTSLIDSACRVNQTIDDQIGLAIQAAEAAAASDEISRLAFLIQGTRFLGDIFSNITEQERSETVSFIRDRFEALGTGIIYLLAEGRRFCSADSEPALTTESLSLYDGGEIPLNP